jgi:hypothetical protein
VAEQVGNFLVREVDDIGRHAKGPRVAGRCRRIAAVQHHLHQIDRLGHAHGPVAGQRGIGPWHPLALLAVALHAVLVVEGRTGAVGGRRCRLWQTAGLLGQALQKHADGLQVGLAQVLRAVQHHFGHRPLGRAAR